MIETVAYKTNPPLDQNVIQTAFGNWQRYGDLLFPPQRQIYQGIADRTRELRLVEYGCGIGVGTAVLACRAAHVLGSDLRPQHVAYASGLYPGLRFETWNLAADGPLDASAIAVAVEVIEHIEDDEAALRHLLDSPEAWLSTPNRQAPGMGQSRPVNAFHVREYIPSELIEKMQPFLRGRRITLHEPKTFEELSPDTTCSPVVYHVR